MTTVETFRNATNGEDAYGGSAHGRIAQIAYPAYTKDGVTTPKQRALNLAAEHDAEHRADHDDWLAAQEYADDRVTY